MRSEPLLYQRLDLALTVPYAVVLEAIAAWFALDLISELDLQWRNTRLNGNRLVLVAKLNEHILEGLDLWLQMGLLTDEQVRLLCRTRFSSELPSPVFSDAIPIATQNTTTQTFQVSDGITFRIPFTERSIPQTPTRTQSPRSVAPVPRHTTSRRTAQMVQSLVSEFSTIWLLFLGVFLVVVSSGVLAASQWSQFPPHGQFAILLGYTLAFWGVSMGTKRQENLRLTTRTLEILTLLMVPVNFWAIDRFQLLSNPIGLIESAIATVILSGITLLLLNQHGAKKLTAFNCVGLSALHLGWGIAGYPLLAVYIGTVGTSLIFFWQQRENANERKKLSLGEIAIAYTTLILLFRAIFIEGVAISDLGLALGICGCIANRLNLQTIASPEQGETKNPQFPISAGLMLLGWAVSVGAQVPWQAAAVSILAIFLLWERLQRDWQGLDLTAIFLITLQTCGLAFLLIPLEMRTNAIAWGMSLLRTEFPIALLGIAVFPYVILTIFVADRLRSSDRPALANLAEALALGLGTLLTSLSFVSPVTRSLNLGLSFAMLFVATNRRDPDRQLIYFTHLVGLGAVAAIADVTFPMLKLADWGILSLAIAVIEWGFSALIRLNSEKFQIWRKSSWDLGIILAGLSYVFLIPSSIPNLIPKLLYSNPPLPYQGLIWSIAPLTLSILGWVRNSPQARASIHLSILSIVLAQVLTFPWAQTRAIGLVIGFVLMLVNTLKLPKSAGLIYFTHLMGLGAIAAIVEALFPILKLADWGMVSLAIAVIELGFSAFIRSDSEKIQIWRKSSWDLGIILAGLSYCALLMPSLVPNSVYSDRSLLTRIPYQSLVWSIAPLTLTILGWIRNFPQASISIDLGITSIVLAQVLTFPQDETRAIGLGVGFVLMLANVLKRQEVAAAAIAVGFGSIFAGAVFWQFKGDVFWLDRIIALINNGAIAVIVLFALRHWFQGHWFQRQAPERTLPKIYSRAMDGWAIAIAVSILVMHTLYALSHYTFQQYSWLDGFLLSICLTTVAMFYRSMVSSTGWAVYFVGWGLELLLYAAIGLANGSTEAFAAANIGLGLASQLLGDVWLARKGWQNFPSAWHVLPIAYGCLGIFIRLGLFADWTGLVTLGTCLIFIGIGRRKPAWNGLTYLGLVGITISIYEIAIYQLSRSSGGSWGDGILILSIATTAIAVTYRLLARSLHSYLRIEMGGLIAFGHIHWMFAVALSVFAALLSPSLSGGMLGTCVTLVLAIYALLNGRKHSDADEFWVYAGIAMMLGSGIYLFIFAYPNSIWVANILRPLAASIACCICVPMFLLPWDAWGWRREPWQRSAIALPLLAVIATATWISIPSLFLVSAFYSWIAKVKNSIRVSYLSVGLVNWALFQFFQQQHLTNSLWYASAIGFSFLYIVQVDPALLTTEAREQRHYLRMLGTGSICATAAVQSMDNPVMAWLSLGIGLAFILGGLSLRVRSYLYVGTLTFVVVVLIQVATWVTRYSLLIWAIGIFAGIVFIWIAANFEARRDRILALVRQVATELQAWE